MSVVIDLERGNLCIKPLLICVDCGGEIANVGESYSSGEKHILLKCKTCEREGKINEGQWKNVVSLYKKFRLCKESAKDG